MSKEPVKKYTLEEAYQEIVRIRSSMGYEEFKSKEEQRAFERGYRQAVVDLTTEFKNRSELLLAINTSRP